MDARSLTRPGLHDLGGDPVSVIDVADVEGVTDREPSIGTVSTGLLVLAGPGFDARWFVDALVAEGRVQRPTTVAREGTTAAAARAAVKLPCALRHWDEDSAAPLGDELDRLGRVRVLVLSRRDLRAAAVVEHAGELAAATPGIPSPTTVTLEGLDWGRIGQLHDTAHLVLSAWHAEADQRGLPTLDLAHEDACTDARAQVDFVHRWLGLDTRLPRRSGTPAELVVDRDDLPPALSRQARASLDCVVCDEQVLADHGA